MIRPDEGQALEKFAFETLYDGQLSLSYQSPKSNFQGIWQTSSLEINASDVSVTVDLKKLKVALSLVLQNLREKREPLNLPAF